MRVAPAPRLLALFALGWLTVSAGAQQSRQVMNGSTSLTFSSAAIGGLSQAGIVTSALYPASLSGTTLTLPLTGGGIDLDTGLGSAFHTGGLSLTSQSAHHTVTLAGLTMLSTSGGAPLSFTALVTVDGKLQGQHPAFIASANPTLPLPLTDSFFTLSNATLALAPQLAALLNSTFHTTGFGSGSVGTATVTGQVALYGTYTVALGDETALITTAERTSWDFSAGPPDGTLGAIPDGDGNYTFFGAANTASTCASDPSTEGSYRLTGTLTSITDTEGCTPVMSVQQADPNGYTFDANYSGGGPALRLTSGQTNFILHVYHGEFHAGTCKNGHTCFYSSLGMAVSTNNGNSFTKLGEIVQPWATRQYVLGVPEDLDVGGGTLVLADVNGNFVPNPAQADPASLYVYVFYDDLDTTLPAPCNTHTCVGVARAKLSDVITAALAGDSAAFPELFRKFYNDGFTQPATSGDPNGAQNSGHYTPVVQASGNFPTVIFDTATKQWVMAFCQSNDSVRMRHGSSMTRWSESDDAAGTFSNAPNGEIYTTLLGGSGNVGVSDGSGYLVYVKDTQPWPDWPDATVTERTITLSVQQ